MMALMVGDDDGGDDGGGGGGGGGWWWWRVVVVVVVVVAIVVTVHFCLCKLIWNKTRLEYTYKARDLGGWNQRPRCTIISNMLGSLSLFVD